MFEGLPIVSLPMSNPVSLQNFRSQLSEYESVLTDDNLRAFDALFSISGKSVQTILPLPESGAPNEDFIHIQTFVMMDSDAHYYTIRRDFSSYLLSYTYDGAGELVYGGKSYPLVPGSGFLIDCRVPHRYRTSGDFWRHSDLHFVGGEAERLYREYEKDQSVLFTLPQELYQPQLEMILRHYSTYSAHRDCFVSSAIAAMIARILLENESSAGATPSVYRALLSFIERNYSQPLSLELLSKRANLTKFHLSREFRKYVGRSPADYITEFRINHAKFLLASTDLPAYRIGELVGIPNGTNFLRHFKKKVGMTPGQYRIQNRYIL